MSEKSKPKVNQNENIGKNNIFRNEFMKEFKETKKGSQL
jgi:hypothetical protein